jgi:hypothetical protein
MKYLRVQYITSNGVILNEIVNERGTPQIMGNDSLPRTDVDVIQSQSFQQCLAGDWMPITSYISDVTLSKPIWTWRAHYPASGDI